MTTRVILWKMQERFYPICHRCWLQYTPTLKIEEKGGGAGSKFGQKEFTLCRTLTLRIAVIKNINHSALKIFRGGLTRHFRVTLTRQDENWASGYHK